MIFCHACGKQIHESAPTCPQCGAVQPAAQEVKRPNSVSALWLPVGSICLGTLTLLATFDDSILDTDTLVGLGVFSVVGIVLGCIGLSKGRSYRNLALAGLIVSVLALLCTIGSTP
jgi:hypothetical protein